jgi:hypothetical protein
VYHCDHVTGTGREKEENGDGGGNAGEVAGEAVGVMDEDLPDPAQPSVLGGCEGPPGDMKATSMSSDNMYRG